MLLCNWYPGYLKFQVVSNPGLIDGGAGYIILICECNMFYSVFPQVKHIAHLEQITHFPNDKPEPLVPDLLRSLHGYPNLTHTVPALTY